MLCQNCHQRESTLHLTKIVNGVATQIFLCQECAQKMQGFGFNMYPGMVSEFLQAMFGMEQSGEPGQIETAIEQEKCPGCGRTFQQIQQAGRMGCSKCYDKFGAQIDQILRRIHGSGTHVGKVPVRTGTSIKNKQVISRLRSELQESIQKEEFEKAALLRDRIKELEKMAGGEKE